MVFLRPYMPRIARVKAGPDGRPVTVDGLSVSQIREQWLVEDGWWTDEPLRRHYFEVVLSDGRNVVVFRDRSGRVDDRTRKPGHPAPGRPDRTADSGRWYIQRA